MWWFLVNLDFWQWSRMVVLGLLVVVGWLWAVVFGWQWLLLGGCGRLFLVGCVGGSICGVFIVVK